MVVRVVVAEDEALIRMDLAEMLEDAGYEVVGQAATGEAAVALVSRVAPDIVLMDVRMPVLDGLSAAEAIAEQGVAAVVMLTAFSDGDLIERARDAGVSGYVVKPASAGNLLPALEVALARFRETQQLRSELDRVSGELQGRKIVDRAKGNLIDGGMDEASAYAWLRRQAMDHRLSMVEVSQRLLDGELRV